MKPHIQNLLDQVIFVAMVATIIGVTWIIVMSTGCSTVSPKPVTATQATFSGNAQNGGILGIAPAGTGFVVNADFRARYNALAATYGKDILPPLKADDGITPLPDGTALIDKQHLVDEILMADWHRMGRAP